jgi:hypothetical protein
MSTTEITKKSPTLAELTKALVNFHRKGIKIPKSSKNPFLNSRYADLSTILDHVQPALNEVGLAIVQMPIGEHELETTLLHESGEWMSSVYKMQPLEAIIDKTTKEKAVTPQSIGSIITYQRRYAIGAVLNLNIDDDTDGNPPNTSTEPAAPKKTATELMAEAKAAKEAKEAKEAAAKQLAQPGKATENPVPLVVDPPAGEKTKEFNLDPCSEADVAEIKKLLGQMEQLEKGFSDRFKKNLAASGRKKIADFTVMEAGRLKSAIATKQMDAFFASSLTPAATTGQQAAA